MLPKKWHEVYPYGTKEGDEEAKVFKALSRHTKYDFRSTGALQKATGISQQRIEEIIDKYVNHFNPPLILVHPKNEDHWGYWERCANLIDENKKGISQKEQDSRVDRHLGDICSCGEEDACTCDSSDN